MVTATDMGLMVLLAFVWIGAIAMIFRTAKAKGRSLHWMWFGIHPVTALIAWAILAILKPKPITMRDLEKRWGIRANPRPKPIKIGDAPEQRTMRDAPEKREVLRGEVCDFEKGDTIDRIVQGGRFGFDRGAGLLIKAKSGQEIKLGVRVSSTVVCHGCGSELPFTAVVVTRMFGGAGKVSCRACGSVIVFSSSSLEVDDHECPLLVATPHVDPISGARFRISFGAVSAEEIDEDQLRRL